MHGSDAIFHHDGVNVPRDGKLIATVKLLGPIYVINMRVCVPDLPVEHILATTEEVLQEWHERLYHQGKRHVRHVLPRVGISV